MTSTKSPTVVVGDGWSALASVGFLAARGEEVRWLAGSGTRVLSPLPGFESGAATAGWKFLASALGLELGAAEEGSFLREFKGKAFREPVWVAKRGDSEEGADAEAVREAQAEALWAPETRFVCVRESRFALSAAEIEEELRSRISQLPQVRRIEGLPLSGIGVEGGELKSALLPSGEEIPCERLIFAERWSQLPGVQGIPKALPFTRKREPMGVLQATFTHVHAPGADIREGFYGALHREAGEQFDRHVWGYFSSDGSRSFWTVCLASDESEDNHQIGKRLRRLKNALERMFSTTGVTHGESHGFARIDVDSDSRAPAGFIASVRDEQVRFEGTVICSAGESSPEAFTSSNVPGVSFLTDGYGPSAAILPVMQLFGISAEETHAETEDTHASGASVQE